MSKKERYKNNKYLNSIEDIEHELKVEDTDQVVEITIYGDIGDFWSGSTSSRDIKTILDGIEGKDVLIRLNSGGGDAFEGIAIYNLLKNYSGKVTICIDGYAASAASIIAMAADELIMGLGTMLMVHEASVGVWGTKKDLKAKLSALEGIDKSLVDIYMTRFDGNREDMEKLVEQETWLTSTEAIEVGLVDSVSREVNKEGNKDESSKEEEDLEKEDLEKEEHKEVDEEDEKEEQEKVENRSSILIGFAASVGKEKGILGKYKKL